MNVEKIFPSSKTLKSKLKPFWPIRWKLKGHFTFSLVETLMEKFNFIETLSMRIIWILFQTILFDINIKMVFMFGNGFEIPKISREINL